MAPIPDDERLLKEIYQRLELKPLPPGDSMYERIFDRLEGDDPVANLKIGIEWGHEQSLQLFSGFRGMGKTTELFRLQKELEDNGHLVLYADALDYLSPSEEIDIATMLMSVAGAFGDQLEEITGIRATGESFWQRITNYLTKTSIEVGELSTKLEANSPAKVLLGGLKAGLDVKAALKTAPSFRQTLEAFLSNRLYELKTEVDAYIEEGVKAIRREKGDQGLSIVFLFDQFEQLRGSRSNEQLVIRSVERLFASHLEQLKLPFLHVIYTVPPWLQFTLPGALSIERLPCVRLWNNDETRTPYEPGMAMMRAAIKKRFSPESWQRIFGEEGASGAPVDRLIEMSGGHFRDLLRLFREIIVLVRTRRAKLPLTVEYLERAIVNVQNDYLPIAIDDARWLDRVAKGRDTALPDDSPANIARLSRFLDTHLVLPLTNGKDWYDIHPLIRDEVAKLARLPVEEAQNGSPG